MNIFNIKNKLFYSYFYVITILALFVSFCFSQPLPEGNNGIASQYPNDIGIFQDPNVIYADDFESYDNASGLAVNWNGGVYHDVKITTEKSNVFAGNKSLEFKLPKQNIEWSNTVARELGKNKEVEQLFLRYYTKFDQSFDIVGSSHNGGGMSAHYYMNGQATPGIPANGYNKFLVEFESWRGSAADSSPGLLNVYIYHPEQRSQWGDHWFPNGEVMPNTSIPGNFGSDFVSRTNIRCKLGQWYCCELMVKANTVGLRNGRIACWLDGKLIADFPNLRLRDVDSLKISRFNLSFHAGSNPSNETYKWYDNVVAATSYIGPMITTGAAQKLIVKKNKIIRNFIISEKKISFFLLKSSHVKIDIFNLQGKFIDNLCNKNLSIGQHIFDLNYSAKNQTSSLYNGIYLTKIQIGNLNFINTIIVKL